MLPQWRSDIQQLKPLDSAFSWFLNIRLLQHALPDQVPKHALACAAAADRCLATDRRGWSGPLWLSHLFRALGDQLAADSLLQLAMEIRTAHREQAMKPHEQHIFPEFRFHPEVADLCPLPGAGAAELEG